MNRPFITFLMLIFACAAGHAQEPTIPSASKLDEYMEAGMEVAGVRAPYYDEKGNLKAQLYGGYVKVLEGGVAEVTQLRIDVFQDQQVFMTVFSPHCFTKIEEADGRKVLTVYSEGDVLIDMEQMTIVGRGFNFTSEQNRFEILHDSKVLLENSVRGVKGVEL